MTTTDQELIVRLPRLAEVTVYVCQECSEVTAEEPDLDRLYECPECGDVFRSANGAGRGTQCPNDNKFGSRRDSGGKAGVRVCPSCDAGEVEEERREVCPECDPTDEDAMFDDEAEYVRHYVAEHY